MPIFAPVKIQPVNNKHLIFLLFSIGLYCIPNQLTGQQDTLQSAPKKERKWFQSISIGGYIQVRYNGLFETNRNLDCDQCDKAWGEGSNFSIRRARIVLSGQIHPQIYFYIQPDFASSPASGVNHFAQLRDAYFDLGIDKENEFRLRVGQSKVPYGFENMQSSQNRISLDRNDALNSAVANERDLGVFFYWAPAKVREQYPTFINEAAYYDNNLAMSLNEKVMITLED